MISRIRVAKTAGFCFGVQRALDKILTLVNKTGKPVWTCGPLIHNEHVLDAIRSRGIEQLSPDQDLTNSQVVIRAHGVTPEVIKQLKQQGAIVCNATCPKVAQVQGIVKKYSGHGYRIAIIGDPGHAEVDSLVGFSRGRGFVVSTPEQVDEIPPGDKLCVVTQTTQDRDVFENTIAALRRKFPDCIVFDTICNATSDRQSETIRIAEKSDLMIVVGGKNSANTRRLLDIASSRCTAVLIQSAADLSYELLRNKRNIGITAGASTPAWIIRCVIDSVRKSGVLNPNPLVRYFFHLLFFLLNRRLLFSLSFSVTALSVAKICGVTRLPMAALTGFVAAGATQILRNKTNPYLNALFSTALISCSTVLIPFLVRFPEGNIVSEVVFLIYTALLVFSGNQINDLRNLQMDFIHGRRSLSTQLGKKTAERIITYSLTALLLLISTAVFLGFLSDILLLLCLVPLYYGGLLYLSRRGVVVLSLTSNLIVDAGFYLSAFILFIGSRLI